MKNLYKIENELYIVDNTEEINKYTKTCWCIDIYYNKLVLHQGVIPSYHYKNYKKIIMTTDKSINVLCSCGKDCGAKESGIQAIDDDFLEWFVNKSSCEEVEIEQEILKLVHNPNYVNHTPTEDGFYFTPKSENLQYGETLIEDNIIDYKIIIPDLEQKLENIVSKQPSKFWEESDKRVKEKESLEEVAYKLFSTMPSEISTSTAKSKALELAKWQQEQDKSRYSEEEVMDMFHNLSMHLPLHYEFLVKEQFKKK